MKAFLQPSTITDYNQPAVACKAAELAQGARNEEETTVLFLPTTRSATTGIGSKIRSPAGLPRSSCRQPAIVTPRATCWRPCCGPTVFQPASVTSGCRWRLGTSDSACMARMRSIERSMVGIGSMPGAINRVCGGGILSAARAAGLCDPSCGGNGPARYLGRALGGGDGGVDPMRHRGRGVSKPAGYRSGVAQASGRALIMRATAIMPCPRQFSSICFLNQANW